MVEILCYRRWEKWNRTNFYREVAKICIGSIHYGVLQHFWTSNCAWILLSDFFGQNVSKYLKQFRIKNYI